MTSEEQADYTSGETDRVFDECRDNQDEENYKQEKADLDNDEIKIEQFRARNDTQENFNKVVEVLRELTDKKTDTHGKRTLYLALREFLQTQLNQLDESQFDKDSKQADKNITKICEGLK